MTTTSPTTDIDPAPANAKLLSGRRRLATVAVVAVLLFGALVFNVAVFGLDLRFRKIAMPLRKPIAALDSEVGPWVRVSNDVRFPPDIEKALGTLDYVQRTYVDTRDADPEVLSEYEAATEKTDALRQKLYSNIVQNNPFGVVTLHVAYYTGHVDTVPHIPDRCMVAAGFETAGREEVDLAALPGGEPLTMSFLQFQQSQNQAQPVRHNVAYVFKVNGEYAADAITGVRLKLQDLRVTHAYFAKIEVSSTTTLLDPAKSKAALGDFLTYMLPAVDECLPVWPPETASESAPAIDTDGDAVATSKPKSSDPAEAA